MRIMRYVSFQPWGSVRADGNRRVHTIQRIVDQIWAPDPHAANLSHFVAGSGVLWSPVLINTDSQGKEKITLQTGAGLKVCTLTKRVASEYEFETAMGEADVGEELVLKVGASEVRGVPVSMGNPHYVVFVPRFVEHWQDEAAQIQRSPEFKHGVNVDIVVVESKHDVASRFFERGVGETRSSGTGSCASAVAAMATGRADSPVRVHAPGGTQTVRMERNHVLLRGPARLVFQGDFILS